MQLTLDQQYFIDDNADKIDKMAEVMWDKLNELDPDPSHPQWCHFDDPIKSEFIKGAVVALLSTKEWV